MEVYDLSCSTGGGVLSGGVIVTMVTRGKIHISTFSNFALGLKKVKYNINYIKCQRCTKRNFTKSIVKDTVAL